MTADEQRARNFRVPIAERTLRFCQLRFCGAFRHALPLEFALPCVRRTLRVIGDRKVRSIPTLQKRNRFNGVRSAACAHPNRPTAASTDPSNVSRFTRRPCDCETPIPFRDGGLAFGRSAVSAFDSHDRRTTRSLRVRRFPRFGHTRILYAQCRGNGRRHGYVRQQRRQPVGRNGEVKGRRSVLTFLRYSSPHARSRGPPRWPRVSGGQ